MLFFLLSLLLLLQDRFACGYRCQIGGHVTVTGTVTTTGDTVRIGGHSGRQDRWSDVDGGHGGGAG